VIDIPLAVAGQNQFVEFGENFEKSFHKAKHVQYRARKANNPLRNFVRACPTSCRIALPLAAELSFS
jgi:hypothetical protein